MSEWWSSMTQIQQIFACVAIPATVILIVQTILLFFGIGDGISDNDFDAGDAGGNDFDMHDAADHGDGGLALFSIRGIVAFFAIGGWSGIAMISIGLHPVLASVIAFVLGSAALVGIAFLMKAATRLQYNGTLDLKNAVGQTAKVYIRVPAEGTATGKVNVTVQERLCELDAVNYGKEDLKPGQFVNIIDVKNGDTLVVEAQR